MSIESVLAMALAIDVDSLAARLKHAITISLASVPAPSLSASLCEGFEPSSSQSLQNLVKERGFQSVFSCSKCKARLSRGIEAFACVACGSPQQLAIGKLSQFAYQNSHAFQRFLQTLTPKDLESPDILLQRDAAKLTLGGKSGDSLQVSSINVNTFPLEDSNSFGEFEKAGISHGSPTAKSEHFGGLEMTYPDVSLLSAFMQKADLNITEDRDDRKHAPDFRNLDDLFLNVNVTKSGSTRTLMLKDENWNQPSSEYDLNFLSHESDSGKAVASSIIGMPNETNIDSFNRLFSTGKPEQETNNAQKGADLIDIAPFDSDGEAMASIDDFPDLELWSRKSSTAVSSSLNFFAVNEQEKDLSLLDSQHKPDAKDNSGLTEEAWEDDDFQWTSATFQAELVLPTPSGETDNQNSLIEDFFSFHSDLQNTGKKERQPETSGESSLDVFQRVNYESSSLLEINENFGGSEKTNFEVNSPASSSLINSNSDYDGWPEAMNLKISQDAPIYQTKVTKEKLSGSSNGISLKEEVPEFGPFVVDASEKNTSVQATLSQFHDLSFMLKDHLVIPQNSKTWDPNEDLL